MLCPSRKHAGKKTIDFNLEKAIKKNSNKNNAKWG
jgi:hypothetical protein